jgi:hypothetical protein
MGKKRGQPHTDFGPDDYNQPTEPMEQIVLPPPVDPTTPMGGWYPDAQSVPAPHAHTRPFPQEQVPARPYAQSPAMPVYPVLSPTPLRKQRGQPPGGAAPVYQPMQRLRLRRRSPVPGLVRLCLFLVQLVLLARVVCMGLGIAATTYWLSLLFQASDLFVEPLRWLAAYINFAPLAGTQLLIYLELLLAVLAYGIVSRLLVGLLKALLNH